MTLKDRLKNLLKQHDMTAAQLSRSTEISVQTLNNWLQGQTPRNIHQVKKVAKHFDLTVDEMVFGEPPKTQQKSVIEEFAENEIYAGKYEVILRKIIK